jgi:hypothetical protein
MAKAVRKKPQRKKPKISDQKQSERFIEAAQKLGIEKTGEKFEKAIAVIAKAPSMKQDRRDQ